MAARLIHLSTYGYSVLCLHPVRSTMIWKDCLPVLALRQGTNLRSLCLHPCPSGTQWTTLAPNTVWALGNQWRCCAGRGCSSTLAGDSSFERPSDFPFVKRVRVLPRLPEPFAVKFAKLPSRRSTDRASPVLHCLYTRSRLAAND